MAYRVREHSKRLERSVSTLYCKGSPNRGDATTLRLNPFVHDSLQTERSKNHVPRCSMKFQGSREWEHAKRHIYRGEAARGLGVRARGPRAPLAPAPASHRRGDRGLPLGLLRGRRVLEALRLHRRQDVAPSSLTRLQ